MSDKAETGVKQVAEKCAPHNHHWTNPRADGSNNCLVCGMSSRDVEIKRHLDALAKLGYIEPAPSTQGEPPTYQPSAERKATDWDTVHALLEPWRKVWEGDKAKYLEQFPAWMVSAAEELFAHDLCDAWAWNDYVSAASAIIQRHYAAPVESSPAQAQEPRGCGDLDQELTFREKQVEVLQAEVERLTTQREVLEKALQQIAANSTEAAAVDTAFDALSVLAHREGEHTDGD